MPMLSRRRPEAPPGLNAVDNKAPFVELIERAVHADRLAVLALRPEVFAHAVGVEINDGVGGLEDVARGAVVLLQLDDLDVPAKSFSSWAMLESRAPRQP